MTDFHDRLDQLIARNGEQWLLDFVDVHYPEAEEQFVRRLNQEIDSIVDDLEASAEFMQGEGEEKLSNRVVAMLRRAGYAADAETNNRGHVDILVRSNRRWIWMAECKVHGSYEELREGLRQLLTRYSTGRSPHGALIIFIRNLQGGKVIEAWRGIIRDEQLEGYVSDSDDEEQFCFLTSHEHMTSGTTFAVRHVGVMLYYSPKDKSALARAA
jgi:hypothetical protein